MDPGARLPRSRKNLFTQIRESWLESLLLLAILAAGAALRLYGLNWDNGHWLHPDERQIYFVTAGLSWPNSLGEALSPDSPLNPRFFAYGSLPFYLLKLITALLTPRWPTFGDADNMHLVGRPLAALFDLGTIYLTYRLARILWPPPHKQGGRGWGKAGAFMATPGPRLLAAALVSLAVLHVQLAHFYTTDPLLTFFTMLTLYLAAAVGQDADTGRGFGRRYQVALGIALGLALATKISTALLIVPIFVAYLGPRHGQGSLSSPESQRPKPRLLLTTGLGIDIGGMARIIPTLTIAAVVFVIIQPYVLIDWQTFLRHTFLESQIAWGRIDVPYTRQFAGTLPYLYSTWQTALWALALPLGLVAWAGGCAYAVAALVRWLRRPNSIRNGSRSDLGAQAIPTVCGLLLAWAGLYLAITGALYTRYLRYMLPLVPILCLAAVWTLVTLGRWCTRGVGHWLLRFGHWGMVIGAVLYALAFVRIYAEPHSWVKASAWIYGHVPAGSTLAVEEWDIALPLPLDMDDQPRRIEEYDLRTLPLYDKPDDAAKWEPLAGDLADSDYLILASRRLYGSIPRLPDLYPVTTRYYERLFAGDLGFVPVGGDDPMSAFTRGPAWLNPRLPPLPGASPAPWYGALLRPDESFVVYDHPRALIFRNVDRLPTRELLDRLK